MADYSPAQVARLLADHAIQLIDVREPHEHRFGHIAGGVLIPLGQLQAQADRIGHEPPIVFYCRSGGRSAMAASAFVKAGWDAHNLTGGLLAWEAAGLPLEPEGGYVE